MSLTIRMRGKKWRLAIRNEEWEFNDKKDLKRVVDELIKHKEDYGNIKLCGGVE